MKVAGAAPKRGLTEEQRRAVEMRGTSVALSAGAGCGKTLVLTERFLAYLDPAQRPAAQAGDLARVVAITFTERAAREMRDRIRNRCYERLIESDAHDAQHWAALLRLLDNARISTIHSFCAALLRAHAVEAGLDPQFEVLEQAQADTLLWEVIDDGLRALLARRDQLALDLAALFDLGPLRAMLRALVLDCPPDQFERWLAVSPEQQVDGWESFYRDCVGPAVARQILQSAPVRKLVSIALEHAPRQKTMRARCRALLDTLAAMGKTVDFRSLPTDLQEIQANARVEGGGGAGAWESPEIYAQFKIAANEVRDLTKSLVKFATFDRQDALEAAKVGSRLFSLAEGASRGYAQSKRELGVLDFDDLLSATRRLLADPAHRPLRGRIASQMELLLVDEFQDTDRLQVEVARALCDERTADGKLFFVGDYKQSIYRFRGADPRVFHRLREEIPPAGRQSLTLNFRSQPAILEFVNALFWFDLGDGYEPLRPDGPQVSPTPAVEFLWAPADEASGNKSPSENRLGEGDSPILLPDHPARMVPDRKIGTVPDGSRIGSKQSGRRREAEWIARRVRALLDAGEPIVRDRQAAESCRPAVRAATPGDFAILFRALSDVELYEEALRRHGIEYYLVGGHAFYAQQEIFDLLNLLRVLVSRADEVSLAGVLRSGFFSLADETIFWLAGHREGLSGGLFARDFPDEIAADQQQRARFAASTIRQLRARKDRLRISELIGEAMERTGYDAMLLNEFLGERKLANLHKLIEQARGFERGDFFGLSDYIAQLSQFVARQPDEPLAATVSEDTDVVRLMTIHQAKGLEFPIVIVPDLDRATREQSVGVHFDHVLGPLVKQPDAGDGKAGPGGYEFWRFQERSQELAEAHRLLYVATTRAADYLMLSSSVHETLTGSGPWMELLARRFDLASGRLIGSLPKSEPRPAIRVTADEPPAVGVGHSRRTRVDVDTLIDQALAASAPAVPLRSIDPILRAANARRTYSFSRLAPSLHERRQSSEPIDSSDLAPSGARELGTLVHGVLAAVDFTRPPDLRGLVGLHALRCWPDDSVGADEALDMLRRFAASPRWRELAAAVESHAEVEFLLAWPPDAAARHELQIGGFIDRIYRDSAGRWHILDFKTNRVPPGQLARLASQYEMQMLVYGLAMERIIGFSPASLTLHFLRTGEEHHFDWDDAARQRAMMLVGQGIAAANRPSAAAFVENP